MLNLDELVSVIQKSADAAASSVRDRNMELLSHYFHEVRDDEKNTDLLNSLSEGEFDGSLLRPKVVAVDYPLSNLENHTVLVPLISLAPISQLQMSELELELDANIQEIDGQTKVSFPRHGDNPDSEAQVVNKSNAKIKIKVEGIKTPPGVEMVVEGFDKALRAQIPN